MIEAALNAVLRCLTAHSLWEPHLRMHLDPAEVVESHT